jgi:hypothetical protein
LSAAFALVALGSATALSETALMSSVSAALADTRDYMADRSPGARTGADMSKGKPGMAEERVARALPRTRDARGSTAAPAAPAAAPEAGVIGPLAAPAAAGPGAIFPGGDSFPIGGVAGPGGGGPLVFAPVPSPGLVGGGGGGIIVTPQPETPGGSTPGAPVPEPATWASMLVGFLGIGWALRRRRRVPRHA